jgi:hypothetical protein
VRRLRLAALFAVLIWIGTAAWSTVKPLPPGTRVASLAARLDEPQLDVIEDSADRKNILARELAVIDRADQTIVLDQTPLIREVGQHLLMRKRQHPQIKIVVVADPLPEIYGGTPAHYLDTLEQAGIVVARVRLGRLRDPLPWYSALWRMSVGWWSDAYDETAPRAGLLAALRHANSKADRRQLLAADDGSGGWVGVVPAAEGNLAIAISGGAARDMAASELKIARWSTDDDRLPGMPAPANLGIGSIDARFLTEGAIRAALVDALATAVDGDEIRVSTPELSDHPVVNALVAAASRGARIRVVVDPSSLINATVVGKLRRDGANRIEVRWCAPWNGAGTAMASLAIVRHRREVWIDVGAADFTRSSLDDLNLDAAMDLRLQERAAAARNFIDAFERTWSAASSADPPGSADAPAYWTYRVLQVAGLASY